MPKTPQVNFHIDNQNVEVNTPLLGVTHVLARTTKGPFEDPSTLLNSYAQFQRIFGREMVPDGSISNIEKAFSLGSRIRVSRVKGSGSITKGTSNGFTVSGTTREGRENWSVKLGIRTREAGTAIVNPESFNRNATFYLTTQLVDGLTKKIYFIQTRQVLTGAEDEVLEESLIISKDLIFSGSLIPRTNIYQIDPLVFASFVESVPNLEFYINPEEQTYEGMNSIADLVELLGRQQMGMINVAFGETEETFGSITEGTNGGHPSGEDQWKSAYDAIKGYTDGYQIIASHIHQHFSTYSSVYSYIRDNIHGKYGIILYVEVPKIHTTVSSITTAMETLLSSIGYSQNVAYFAGGIKYYNRVGVLKDCDVLGTVCGLGDASATNYGPWYSFSGMNRGIVPEAVGPVMENLGGLNSIGELQQLADWNCNLFVIKNTRASGQRTMLWHGFTSTASSDSEKFLATERLLIYIKKMLTPILESYLEEPNTFSTWMNIYLEGKQVMDDLIDRNAIERYRWDGDQDKTSFNDLQVNTEAEVRQGKYRIHLHMREIVPLQEIDFYITLDAATGTIEISE